MPADQMSAMLTDEQREKIVADLAKDFASNSAKLEAKYRKLRDTLVAGVEAWLSKAAPEARAAFFAEIEPFASKAQLRQLSKHPLRPAQTAA